MPSEIPSKKSFGTLSVAAISPKPKEDSPRSVNLKITFEEALKLHFGLGQALAKLNSYNRSTTAGKNTVINLCLFTDINRITIMEDSLGKTK